ncbi:NAD(P) transhydrogenase subunit alpha [Lysinimonas soli]|uniref:proton-translocating NAD(P)(+) transhydrogenase n=1 Tax=Lysinimonas soli TaxID=1074233 RepID=A0ABW0NTJ0_9MICO
MSDTTVGVVTETASGERRVALDPDAVARLMPGARVLVEAGAGVAAGFPDEAYRAAGATVASRSEVVAASTVLAVVRCPDDALIASLRAGQLLLGLIDPFDNLDRIATLAKAGITVAAFELLPRTLSRAQSMDALTSQSSAAGYRAAIVAAEAFGRYFPMMITAAGTARPASVIVIGAGVAGLQAIGVAKRLGAVVTGYDVRPASRSEVESVGAAFLTSSVAEGAAQGGYARAMTAEELAAQQAELAERLVGFDVIITTAKVPGRPSPLLVSSETLAALKPGSVCVDLAAGARGGNVAGSVDGSRIVTGNGVTVVGAGQLAAELPTSASQMYARNVVALLSSLLHDGAVVIDPSDEVHANVVLCRDGEIVSAPIRKALGLDPLAPPSPAPETSDEAVSVS